MSDLIDKDTRAQGRRMTLEARRAPRLEAKEFKPHE